MTGWKTTMNEDVSFIKHGEFSIVMLVFRGCRSSNPNCFKAWREGWMLWKRMWVSWFCSISVGPLRNQRLEPENHPEMKRNIIWTIPPFLMSVFGSCTWWFGPGGFGCLSGSQTVPPWSLLAFWTHQITWAMKKTRLFMVYRGLYCPVMWGL